MMVYLFILPYLTAFLQSFDSLASKEYYYYYYYESVTPLRFS